MDWTWLQNVPELLLLYTTTATKTYSFRFKFLQTATIPDRDSNLDYAANYANMMGYPKPNFAELMRLYLVIHA